MLVEKMLNDKELELLSIIRGIAREDGGTAGYWRIYNKSKIAGVVNYRKAGKELKPMIEKLIQEHKISVDIARFQYFIPSPLTDDELELIRQLSKEVKVNDSNIKYCIWQFYKSFNKFPKPSEVEEQFLKEFGRPDQKDFCRVLRFMVADGVLLRDEDDRYYYRGMVSGEDGLRNFV